MRLATGGDWMFFYMIKHQANYDLNKLGWMKIINGELTWDQQVHYFDTHVQI